MKVRNRYVIDTGIFPLILAGDPKLKPIVEELHAGRAAALACEFNLAELYYKVCEKKGRETAEITDRRIRRQESVTAISAEEELSRIAGQLKCVHRDNVSLADCYAAATAKSERATLLTTNGGLARIAKSEGIKALLYAP